MGQAIEHIRARLDNEPLHTQFIVGREVLREAVAEADKLLRQWNTQRETILAMDERENELKARGGVAQAEIAALRAELARKAFEIQVLEMTQGALKMEIDRLRSAPVVAAMDATVTISHDGITLSAPMVSITGAVTAITGDVVPA